MNITEQINAYIPYNEQEERDKKQILEQLQRQDDLFFRENMTAHMTASAWVVNMEMDQVLMVYHNIYHSWSWIGGHADGEKDLLAVAIKEVKEESGLVEVTTISKDIFSLEILTVDGHEKGGSYVPSHLHLNITYLLKANENQKIYVKPDENSGVAWFSLEEAIEKSTEPWFQERIYKKLNDKLKSLK